MENLQERVITLISKSFKVSNNNIKLESKFIEDLGADSLDVVEFVLTLEDTFDVVIPESKAQSISTVNDAVKFLEELLAKKS
jgi:acyl carrier protein